MPGPVRARSDQARRVSRIRLARRAGVLAATVVLIVLTSPPGVEPVQASSASASPADTAEDPIPVRPGDVLQGAIATPSPHLGSPWHFYMRAPYPFPGAVVFRFEPDASATYVFQARSMDFDTGLRLSRVMPGGEVIPLEFNNVGPGNWYYCLAEHRFTDSEIRAPLIAGHSYRIEVFPWGPGWWPPQRGEFNLLMRRETQGTPDAVPEWEAESGMRGRPLWWHRLEYLRRVAERARRRGNVPREWAALTAMIQGILDAAPPPGREPEGEGEPLARFEEVLALMERLEALEADPALPRVASIHESGVEPDVCNYWWLLKWRERILHYQGKHEEAAPPDRMDVSGTVDLEWIPAETRIAAWEEMAGSARGSGDDLRLHHALVGLMSTLIEEERAGEAARLEAEIASVAEALVPWGEILATERLGVLLGVAEASGDEAETARRLARYNGALRKEWEMIEAGLERAGYRHGVWRMLNDERVGRGNYTERHRKRGARPDFGASLKSRRRIMERALAYAEEQFGPGDERVARTLLTFNPLWDPLEVRLARPDRALEILERIHGPGYLRLIPDEMLDPLSDWSNWGSPVNSYEHVGRLGEAMELYEETLARAETDYGIWSRWWEVGAGRVALLLDEMLGRSEEALALASRALEVTEANGRGPGVPVYGATTGARVAHAVVVRALLKLGQDQEALERAQAAVEAARRYWPRSRTTGLLENLLTEAGVRRVLGDLDGARRLYEETLRRLPDVWRSWGVVKCRASVPLAEMHWEEGRPERARSFAEQAVDACEGGDPTLSGDAADVLARILADLGDETALEKTLRSELDRVERIRLTSMAVSERRALEIARARSGWSLPRAVTGLDAALSLIAERRLGAPEARSDVLDVLVRSRAVVLDEISSRHLVLADASDPEVRDLLERYRTEAQRLSNAELAGISGRLPRKERAGILRTLRERADEAEAALAMRTARVRRSRAARRAGLAEVRDALPPGSALISFKQFERVAFTRSDPEEKEPAAQDAGKKGLGARPRSVSHYSAFVLKAEEEQPTFVSLGDAGRIDEAVSAWREALTSDQAALRGMGLLVTATPDSTAERTERNVMESKAFREAGAALRKLVWDPIAAHVDEAGRVFIVPDGALNLVSFAALPDGDGGWLVESGPVLHYLSAERDLVRRVPDEKDVDPPSGEGQPDPARLLLALGGPDYDTETVFAALRHEGETPVDLAAAAGSTPASDAGSPGGGLAGDLSSAIPVVSTFRGERSGCKAFGEKSFTPLPHMEQEIEEITALWQGAGGEGRNLALLGPDATESAFKTRAPGSSVVHLATHGFFLGGKCESVLDTGRGFGAVATAENPLILSGLALAGANNREHTGPDEDDGVLTAQEIAAMDLSGVEWAVLSACDTGVGEIKAGEGVLGLRRAFQVAGADTLILSLWSVEDEATRAWMRALYEGRLVKKMDTAAAVRHASLTVLQSRRDRGLPDHPFFWAGFVAAGDWR